MDTSPLLTILLVSSSSSPSSSSSTVIDPNDIKCELCEEGEDATIHCGDCDQFLGPRCLVTHGKSKLFTHHRPQSLDAYFAKSGGQSTKRSSCQKHPALEVDTYCKTCNVIVCAKCLAESHSGHQFYPLSEESARLKEDLITLTAEIAVRETEAEKGMKNFAPLLGDFQEHEESAEYELAKAFASLREEIDLQEMRMFGQLNDGAHSRTKMIQIEKDQVEFTWTQFKGYREMSEVLLKGGNDVQVVTGHSMVCFLIFLFSSFSFSESIS